MKTNRFKLPRHTRLRRETGEHRPLVECEGLCLGCGKPIRSNNKSGRCRDCSNLLKKRGRYQQMSKVTGTLKHRLGRPPEEAYGMYRLIETGTQDIEQTRADIECPTKDEAEWLLEHFENEAAIAMMVESLNYREAVLAEFDRLCNDPVYLQQMREKYTNQNKPKGDRNANNV